ncbi:MAG TPA: dihydroorotase [Flavisolibacter sp.]|nr:dihydroorotase [Flavisolibacter sp.]
MDILLRQVLITDPSSPFHQQQADIFIQNGIIAEIGIINRSSDKEVSIRGLSVSPGWTDIFSNFCDPGFEFKETLESGAKAAASGGYTDVFILPNTNPVVHNKSGVEYIVQRSKSLPVNIHPIAAITKNTEGKELAEMYDMYNSGAVAFSDGTSSVQSSGLLLKALQYIKAIDKTIIQLPDDKSISASGLINEGIISTQLGLPGKPAIAEELMIARDIELAQYTDSRIHFTGVSTAAGLALIKTAKEKGIAVSCSVTPYHLFFSDEDLTGYDTNLKVNPPLRTKADREALKQGVISGLVDCIATHHMPQETDHKMVEFEYANYGMTGLETCFGLLRTSIPELSAERIVALLSIRPRTIFGLPSQTIEINKPAALSLFNPQERWKFEHTASRSHNSPLFGIQLTGKPAGIINKDSLFLNQ